MYEGLAQQVLEESRRMASLSGYVASIYTLMILILITWGFIGDRNENKTEDY